MPTEIEKRAARLAVSRYGADATQVKRAWREALLARQQGQAVDLLDWLAHENLLTLAQVSDLRAALAETQIDPVEIMSQGSGVRSQESEVARSQESGVRNQEAGVRSRALTPDPRSLIPDSRADQFVSVGEYRILRKLGEGGMGSVYLAYQESADRQVALKVLAPHLTGNPALVERFEREGQLSSKLEHPNIVRGLGVGVDEAGRHYLVMEYVDGPSIQALLAEHRPLKVADAVRIILDIAHALEYAQSRNIVHRDIQPENILITRTGVAKLSDLGLAKQTDQVSHLTATRQGFGTPYYMPYEQAINARHADGRSDIYALGATLYQFVTGEVPFNGETLLEILEKKEAGAYPPAMMVQPEIPEVLNQIIDKMMARDPRDRYQTASELIVDLERSQLAAPVLSFVNPDTAMRDPLVRARAALQMTQPDLQRTAGLNPAARGDPDVWYLRYLDKAGKPCRGKATTQQILERLREGRINGTTQASHAIKGPYRKLATYPEFHDAMRKAAEDRDNVEAPYRPDESWSRGWFYAACGLGVVLIVVIVLYLLS